MRQVLRCILMSIGILSVAHAQFTYTFTAVSGTFTANAGPTTIITSGTDDGLSAVTNIGFTFTYGCTNYTQFIASSNGWMSFNTGITSANLTNDLNTNFDRPIIAPLWDDLAVGSGGNVNYRLTGTAPNRVLTIEWSQMEWSYSATTWGLSFQVKLYETTNVIEFIYTRNGGAAANLNSPSASIGIAGPVSGQFYSLNGTGASPTASTVTETTTLSTKPANGQIYRFTPASVACSGTPSGGTANASPTSTNCLTLTTTLSVTGATAACGISYQWQSSPNNSTWTNIPGATSATYNTSNTATTYYRCVITCSNSGLSANSSSVLVTFTGAVPANDLPCNAEPLVLGVSSNGDNGCSGNASEPGAPACWINGNINTVWYSVVCPASGQLKIKTIPVSSGTPLQNTQIAVYSGTCSSLVYVNCNDDAPACGGYSQLNSELSLTGLTPGATYFIVVDGNFDATGLFEILVIDGTGSFPVIPGQDCVSAFPVCNQTMTIGNPGYQVIGGVCDHDGNNNCTSGEANSVWYTINIATAGTLQFDIIPNDYGNPNPITGQINPGYTLTGDETDYDWVLWKTAGAGATNCATIQSSGGNNAVICNFSYLGVTGSTNSGNAPAAYGAGFDAAYEVAPAVVAGEQYILVVQNFSNSTSGFTLQFPLLSPVLFAPTTTLYWTGGANSTAWTNASNWGGCGTPACALNADITTASAFQPVLPAGTYTVRDLTINAGASLTLQNGATLQICGNLTNNGNLICQPGSTIEFVGAANQAVTGSFVGADGFHHLVVTKLPATGSVTLNNDIDIKGNFTTTNATSILNSNGRYVTLSGNFNNNDGNNTYSNTGATGTLEFNGTAAQSYNQGSSQLDLNFVLMNHTGTGVNLATNMFIKTATGTLTLTNGKINTVANRVDVANSNPACVTTGNNNSYVNGNLWRTILAAGGAYNFPVGTATLFERALLTFGANTYTRIQSRFDPWPAAPNTQGGTECAVTYSLPSENMGYWTMTQTGGNTGSYNTTLYCNGATNTAGANAWTVEKATSVAGPWTLNGACAASTATVVNRTGMSGFSVLAAAQAPTPLPVELTIFDGHENGDVNVLSWSTESEINNDYFEVEKSSDGVYYEDMERVEGSDNTNTVKNYGAVDEHPFMLTYYRLRQVDNNGDFVYYGPIVITNNSVDDFAVQNIYPNPADQSFLIELFAKNIVNAEVYIYDAYGREVYQRVIEVDGLFNLQVESASWSPGVYVIKVVNEEKHFQHIGRIIVK